MDTGKVQQRVEAVVASGTVLGLSLAFVEGGQLTFTEGYGTTATGEGRVPVTVDTLFSYGSIAKTLCATLIMRLVEKGVLELDRPLVTYLPGLIFSETDAGSRLTLRHILSHTSGLPAAGRDYGPRGVGALQRVIEDEIPHYAFLAAPGKLHLYSNSAFCIAGYAAEIVTGLSYELLVQKYVLEPLGMAATTFRPARRPAEQLALPHEESHHATSGKRRRAPL